jgi:hypothetical protein
LYALFAEPSAHDTGTELIVLYQSRRSSYIVTIAAGAARPEKIIGKKWGDYVKKIMAPVWKKSELSSESTLNFESEAKHIFASFWLDRGGKADFISMSKKTKFYEDRPEYMWFNLFIERYRADPRRDNIPLGLSGNGMPNEEDVKLMLGDYYFKDFFLSNHHELNDVLLHFLFCMFVYKVPIACLPH